MPYIKNDGRREKLQKGDIPQNAGELNYQLFYFLKYNPSLSNEERKRICEKFVKQFVGDSPNYQRYNDMTGCLVRCYCEVKRRLFFDADFLLDILGSYNKEIDIYEDLKIKENGEV